MILNTYVNNNGNVTFDQPSSEYDIQALINENKAIIAPFFADVDTRKIGRVQFGTGQIDGRSAYAAT